MEISLQYLLILLLIMKKLYLLIQYIFICSVSFAQNEYISPDKRTPYLHNLISNKKFSIEVNLGIGIPAGDYGNTAQVPLPSSDTTHVNGLASTGFYFNVTAGYLFSPFFGGMVMVGGNLNSFNEGAWQTLRSTAIPGITTSVDGNFYIGEYLIGPYASVPASNKVKIEFKALLGLVTANYPLLTQTFPYYGTTVVEVKNIKNSSNFGYYFGAGLKCMVTNNIGIYFNFGYTGSDIGYPEVDVTIAQTGYPTYTVYSTHERFMLLGIIQMTGGVSYNW